MKRRKREAKGEARTFSSEASTEEKDGEKVRVARRVVTSDGKQSPGSTRRKSTNNSNKRRKLRATANPGAVPLTGMAAGW